MEIHTIFVSAAVTLYLKIHIEIVKIVKFVWQAQIAFELIVLIHVLRVPASVPVACERVVCCICLSVYCKLDR